MVTLALTVTFTTAVPPAERDTIETLGAAITPAAEIVGMSSTGPVNPLRLFTDRTVEPEDPA